MIPIRICPATWLEILFCLKVTEIDFTLWIFILDKNIKHLNNICIYKYIGKFTSTVTFNKNEQTSSKIQKA